MRIRLALGLGFLALLQGCSSQPASQREPSAVRPPQQILQEKFGYTLKERHAEFLRYSFKSDGEFLISAKGFKYRPAAEGFCSIRPGFELADRTLVDQLMKAKFPFDDAKKGSFVSSPVLSRGHSGYVFWVKGSSVDEEAAIASRFDHVLELLDDCRRECSGIARLGAINSRLVSRQGREREPHAICVSESLKRRLATQ